MLGQGGVNPCGWERVVDAMVAYGVDDYVLVVIVGMGAGVDVALASVEESCQVGRVRDVCEGRYTLLGCDVLCLGFN